jgi:hypothetical protein
MPTHPRGAPTRIAAALAALACPAASAFATEHTRLEPIWIETVKPDGAVGHTIPALLNMPTAWMVGDAAVVVLSDGPWPGLGRERLVAGLLGEGAAVLELDVTTSRGFSPENAKMGPPATPEELLPDVRGAADTLRRDAGAGLVVALGHGAGGDAAVLAAGLERTARPGAGSAIAAASLGPGPAQFALGGAETGRGWPTRARLLCGVLATQALPFELGAEANCRQALAGPGEAHAVRTQKP